MNRKNYASPEVEIEKFLIKTKVVTLSQDPDDGLEGSGSDYEGGSNWDF